jgi:peptide/nickel transport system permease protein
MILLLVAVLGGGWLVSFASDPTELVAQPLSPPSTEHWFGTNGQGQSVLLRTLAGGAMTLTIAVIVASLVVSFGTFIGILAAMQKGLPGRLLDLLINVTLVVPGLPLAVVIAAYAPPGPLTMIMLLSLTGWSWTARVMKAQAASLRERDFVLASRLAGEPTWRIMFFDIVPNLLPIMAASFIGACTYAMGAQVGLEFLGLGDLSVVTWGTNLYWAQNDGALLTGAWWTYVPSGLGLAMIGYLLTMLNRSLDEIANPRLGDQRSWLKHLGARLQPEPGYTPVVRETKDA